MEVAAESGLEGLVVGVGMGVNPLKTGAVGEFPFATGVKFPFGVEACRVANRSESGVAGAANRLHPSRKNNVPVSHKRLYFFIVQFYRFKIEFLT